MTSGPRFEWPDGWAPLYNGTVVRTVTSGFGIAVGPSLPRQPNGHAHGDQRQRKVWTAHVGRHSNWTLCSTTGGLKLEVGLWLSGSASTLEPRITGGNVRCRRRGIKGLVVGRWSRIPIPVARERRWSLLEGLAGRIIGTQIWSVSSRRIFGVVGEFQGISGSISWRIFKVSGGFSVGVSEWISGNSSWKIPKNFSDEFQEELPKAFPKKFMAEFWYKFFEKIIKNKKDITFPLHECWQIYNLSHFCW